jgi:hypothetical protein
MLLESISVAIEACEDDSSNPPGAGVLAASGSLERTWKPASPSHAFGKLMEETELLNRPLLPCIDP